MLFHADWKQVESDINKVPENLTEWKTDACISERNEYFMYHLGVPANSSPLERFISGEIWSLRAYT